MADKFQLKAIISAVDKLSPTLKGIQLNAKITRKSIRDIGNAGNELMNKVGIPGALAFGSVVFGAVRATQAAVDYASSIQDASDRTGAGIENYQALTNMLGQVGGGTEDAEAAFTKFNKGAATAAAGANKSFAGLMAKLRIPLKNANGEVRSLTDSLPDLAAAFAKNQDPAQRTRMAMELFGKGGAKMIPVLLGIAEGTLSVMDAQKKMGFIMSKESVEALDNLGDSTDRVTTQIKATFGNALAKVAPLLENIIQKTSDWIGNNNQLIQSKISDFLTSLTSTLAKVDWLAMIDGIKQTISSMIKFVDMIGGMRTILIGLGVAWLAGPVSALITIGVSIAKLIPVVYSLMTGFIGLMAANPVLFAIMAAVALLAGAVYLIYKNWEPIKGWFISLWETIKTVFSSGWEIIKQIFAWSPLGMILQNWGPVVDFFKGLWDSVSNILGAQSQAAPGAGNRFGSTGVGAQPASPRSNLIMAANGSNARVNGEMTVKFENAPQGMRVDSGKTNQSGFSLNPDVGYRSLGLAS